MPYYAVAKGRETGIFSTWEEARLLVTGFSGAKFKKFSSLTEAEDFNKTYSDPSPATDPPSRQGIKRKNSPSTGISPTKNIRAEETIKAFTDGACHLNGKKGAKAGYAVVWPDHRHLDHSALLEGQLQTNNRAEYMAVIHCMRTALQHFPRSHLVIHTDSMLLINTITKWLPEWVENGWKKSDESEIANLDLVKQLYELKRQLDVKFKHVRAHTGGEDYCSVWNAVVDKMAGETVE